MVKKVALISALILTFGCGGEETVPPEETPTIESQGQVTGEPVPIQGSTELMVEETEEVSLLESATLSPAGGKEKGEAGETGEEAEYRVGETLELRVTVLEVPEKLAAWVNWIGPEDQRVETEQQAVPQTREVVFEADTTGWPEGEYEAEIYIGGDLAEIRRFRLLSRASTEGE